jgi:hypothetical protein
MPRRPASCLDGSDLGRRQRKRQSFVETSHERTADQVFHTDLGGLHVSLSENQSQLHAKQLVEDEPTASSHCLGNRLGSMNAGHRRIAVHEIVPVEHRHGKRVEESSTLRRNRSPQCLGHEGAHVAGLETALVGLRVDGDDRPGLVADKIDHRIRHLTLASKEADLAEDHGLGPGRQLTLSPCLVEEAHVEVGRAIGDGDGDHHPPTPYPP